VRDYSSVRTLKWGRGAAVKTHLNPGKSPDKPLGGLIQTFPIADWRIR
jgi:hypothetical protein